jgi:hypothetical protein
MTTVPEEVAHHLRKAATEQFSKSLVHAQTIIVARDDAARLAAKTDLKLNEVESQLKRKADELVDIRAEASDMKSMAMARARDHAQLLAQLKATQEVLEETTVRYFPQVLSNVVSIC